MAASLYTAKDGYQFEQKEHNDGSPNIAIIEHKTRKDLLNAWIAAGMPRVEDLGAWSQSRKGLCIIHIMDPKVVYEPELLGHEMMHCIYGNFHPNQR
jgi:hypothetical protein